MPINRQTQMPRVKSLLYRLQSSYRSVGSNNAVILVDLTLILDINPRVRSRRVLVNVVNKRKNYLLELVAQTEEPANVCNNSAYLDPYL